MGGGIASPSILTQPVHRDRSQQVHPVQPLYPRLQRDPEPGRVELRRSRLRAPSWSAGADQTMLERPLRKLRPVCGLLPSGRPLRSDEPWPGPDQSGHQGADDLFLLRCRLQLELNVRNGKIVRVTNTAEAPVNGMAVVRERALWLDDVHHPERLTRR